MYAPGGLGVSEVGDVELVAAGDELHLFHLTLPNHDLIQHAVSRDGLAWRALPTALRTGDPGACDDDQLWTMSVTERDGAYVMLYTALARADGGAVERIALARSTDLVHWIKDARNPVALADPRWYEADPSQWGRVSWRDPKPIKEGDRYYAAVCAREAEGPLLRRGCVGLLASDDLATWEVRPPLFTPRRFWDLECPQVAAIGDRFYLTAGAIEDRSQRYWTAPSFAGPYETPADGGVLAPAGHYAGRICRWGGQDLYVGWHLPSASGVREWTRPYVDWTAVRNPYGKFVMPPLVLEPRADGTLARRPFPGWSAYLERPLAPLPDQRVCSTGGERTVAAGGEEVGDVWFEGRLAVDARRFGLAFRLDDDGGGYVVEIDADSGEVALLKWLPTRDPRDGRRSFQYAELQRGRLRRSLAAGGVVPFRLLVVGPYLECALDDEVILATLSAERERGWLGVWSESGTVVATDQRWAPMRRPRHE